MNKKTKSYLEKRFDASKFTPLFSRDKKSDDNSSSIDFEHHFNQYEWNTNDTSISFPLHNYLIDRYLGTKHSFIPGDVMINLKFPFLIEKKEGEIILSKYCPELWDIQGLPDLDIHAEYFEELKVKFSKICMSKYPSLKTLSLGHKIRFESIVYDFCEETQKQDVSRIEKMLNQLFDDDVFMKYFVSVLLPYILHLQLSNFNHQIYMINIHKARLKSAIETT